MAKDQERQRLRFTVLDLLTHVCWLIVKIGNEEFAHMALVRIEEIRRHLNVKIAKANNEDL